MAISKIIRAALIKAQLQYIARRDAAEAAGGGGSSAIGAAQALPGLPYTISYNGRVWDGARLIIEAPIMTANGRFVTSGKGEIAQVKRYTTHELEQKLLAIESKLGKARDATGTRLKNEYLDELYGQVSVVTLEIMNRGTDEQS